MEKRQFYGSLIIPTIDISYTGKMPYLYFMNPRVYFIIKCHLTGKYKNFYYKDKITILSFKKWISIPEMVVFTL